MTCLDPDLLAMGRRARAAAALVRNARPEVRTRALEAASVALLSNSDAILAANAEDISRARAGNLSDAQVDRLMLGPDRLAAIANAVAEIAALPDPLGRELARWTRPNGLDIARVCTPIGVLAIIYESRPNVTADAAALCLRSGNVAILRCGSDCLSSSLAIHCAFAEGLAAAGLPADSIQLVATPRTHGCRGSPDGA